MKCKNCEINEGIKYSKYASGEFCSKQCACQYSSLIHRKDINEKLSLKNKGKKYVDGCLVETNAVYISRKKYYTKVIKKIKSIVIRRCSVCSAELCYSNISGYCYKCIVNTKEYLLKLRKPKRDSSKMGGLREGGGKSKVYEYNSPVAGQMKLNKDEIRVAVCLDLLNIKWKRNWIGFKYIDVKNKNRKYYPDFYLIDFDCYVEYKGWVTPDMLHKMKCAMKLNNFKLLTIYSDDARYKNLGLNLKTIEENPHIILDKIGGKH